MTEETAIDTDAAEFIPTRRSLLSRLKDWEDHASWRAFFDTYWKLIYNTALKTGLTDAEAQDVVQETMVSVSKAMPTFDYQKAGSFKAWLMQLTGWRIKDQIRKRQLADKCQDTRLPDSRDTAELNRLADPAGLQLESVWDEEWKKNAFEVALDRVKKQVDPKHYQMFDFYVVKKWPLARVTKALKVNSAKVYLAKHRISALIKKEIATLQTEPVTPQLFRHRWNQK